MYQFERLLAIFHPEISEHFKRQSISPECYIVSWIITLFASSYQYTLEGYLIDFLWERFIIWGWPEFFRFVLWVFSLYKVICNLFRKIWLNWLMTEPFTFWANWADQSYFFPIRRSLSKNLSLLWRIQWWVLRDILFLKSCLTNLNTNMS